jgi:dTMP kinase
VARSLARVPGERADALRAAVAARDRLLALRAAEGVDGPLARDLRERLFAHAPKRVLRSLAGVHATYAWALRERALPLTKEALDSIDAMDGERAWALRAAGVERWPATALSSLRHLAGDPRADALVARALAAAPGNVAVLRNAHLAWCRRSAADAADRPEPFRAAAAAGAPAPAAGGARTLSVVREEERCPT